MSKQTVVSRHTIGRGTLRSYATGFILSIVLTLIPFWLVVENVLNGTELLIALFGLAVGQLFVQLQFFIHLGHESGPRWNYIIFAFMLIVLLIVVIGSLWIMNNLNYHMMPADHVDHKLMQEEGIYRQ